MPSAKKTNGWQHKKIGGKLLLQTFEGKSSLLTNESLYLLRGGILPLYRTPERVEGRTLLLSFHQKIFWLRMKNYTGDMIWQ